MVRQGIDSRGYLLVGGGFEEITSSAGNEKIAGQIVGLVHHENQKSRCLATLS